MCDAAAVPEASNTLLEKVCRRPVVAVTIISLAGWALLLLAVGQGWLGPPVGRGSEFCEATRAGLIKQPVNTWSNLGFTASALATAWQVSRSTGRTRTAMTCFAVLVALLGPGSAAMHATETAAGGQLDQLSMYLLASFATAYALVRSGRLDARWGGWLFVVLVALCEVIGSIPTQLPVLMHPGNAIFAALLLTTLVLEFGLVRRDRLDPRWGLASVGTLVLAFVIWNGAKDGSALCWPYSIAQGHGIWHLLDALAAYFLARHYLATEQHPSS